MEVAQAGSVGGADGAEMHESTNGAGFPGRRNDVGGSLPVDRVELARAAADDRHQVNHLGNAAARFCQGVRVGDVAIADVGGRRLQDALAARAANHDAHFVVRLKQLLDHVAAQKPGGAGYEDGHKDARWALEIDG